ncbi:MAG: polysaccharide biosynthesis C-terminal domain-containing protein [Oscillospiraceae bacterium]|nr:polysaccharide biosynthesis C-terminal domain-containing protein [Oscillospiraceae bacterium]
MTNTASNAVNLLGNYLLINGNFGFPALGVKGAAIATVSGSCVAAVISLSTLASKNGYLRQRNLTYIQYVRVSFPREALSFCKSFPSFKRLLV